MKRELAFGILIGATLVSPAWAMNKEEKLGYGDDFEMGSLVASFPASRSVAETEGLESLRTALRSASDPNTACEHHQRILALLNHSREDLECALAFVEGNPTVGALVDCILRDPRLPQEPEAKAKYQWRVIQIYRTTQQQAREAKQQEKETAQREKEVEIWKQFPPHLIEKVTTEKVARVMTLTNRADRERLAFARSLGFEAIEDPEASYTKVCQYDEVFSAYFNLYKTYLPVERVGFLSLYMDRLVDDSELPPPHEDEPCLRGIDDVYYDQDGLEEFSLPPAKPTPRLFPKLPEQSVGSNIDFTEFEKAVALYESEGAYMCASVLAAFRLFKLADRGEGSAQLLKVMYWEEKLDLLGLLIKARQDEAAIKLFYHILGSENSRVPLDLFDLMVQEGQKLLAGNVYTHIYKSTNWEVMLDLLERLVKRGGDAGPTRNLYDRIYASGIKEYQDRAIAIFHPFVPAPLSPVVKALKGLKGVFNGDG